nr:Zn-ribbon domain-containing OB-fold protein [Candidatus Freyarchaeota archaeon]
MERFFEELKNRRFMVPRCEECGKHIFPPRVFCPFCGSERLEWVEVSGRGTLYAYTTNKGGLHFREQTVGIVELEEGFRILSLIGRPLEELRIGQPVKLEFIEVETLEGKVTLHKFTPIPSQPQDSV